MIKLNIEGRVAKQSSVAHPAPEQTEPEHDNSKSDVTPRVSAWGRQFKDEYEVMEAYDNDVDSIFDNCFPD